MGPFRVVVADPAWKFRDKLPKRRGAEGHYRVMTVDEICALVLPPIANDALLFLWRVSSQGEAAYRVMRAWGFRPHSEIVWLKSTRAGKDHFGMGRIVRGAHETCLIGVRGRPSILARNVRSVFRAPVGRHSEKPEVFYSIVESLSAGPYVELFARRGRQGWSTIGDEAPRPRTLEVA